MTELWPHIAILGFVAAQRLIELPVARANTARLLAAGGREVAPGHYPYIVAMHAAWLISLWVFALGRPINIPLLILFGVVELARVWVLRTLGPRWTGWDLQAVESITAPVDRAVMRLQRNTFSRQNSHKRP